MDEKIGMLRHALATLAYRAAKALNGAPPEFADFGAPESPRTPGKILAHMGDLLDWALAMANGRPEWHDSPPAAWEEGTVRFFAALEALDARLASGDPPAVPAERLFQGPVADALTHVGQIAMLRRMAGCPLRGENYYVAEVTVGRVGRAQAAPRKEF
jgi:hypothetical protein